MHIENGPSFDVLTHFKLMPFQKGNPGGPKSISGRKPLAVELGLPRLLEQCWTTEQRKEVIRTLHALAIDKENRNCVNAAKLLMAYAYGKPTERVEVSQVNTQDEQLRSAKLSFILAAVPELMSAHPDWNQERVQSEAEQRFEEWLNSLNPNPVMTETVQ